MDFPLHTRKDTPHAASRSKQAGFTMVEIMIVIAIIGILTYLVVQGLSGNQDTARASDARTFFTSSLPSSVTSYGAAVGQNSTISAADDLIPYGAPVETAWGDSWSVSSSGTARDGVTIQYPIGGNNPTQIGDDLVTFLQSCTVDASGGQATSGGSGDCGEGNFRFPYLTNVSNNDGAITLTTSQM